MTLSVVYNVQRKYKEDCFEINAVSLYTKCKEMVNVIFAKSEKMRLNFRQRLAWVMVFLYLGGTLIVVHYVFKLIDRYGSYTMEHSKTYHSNPSQKYGWSAAAVFWQHLADIPFTAWLVLGCIPYLQFFCVLLLCTKSQPSVHFRNCIIPVIGWFYIIRVGRFKKDLKCVLDDHVNYQKHENNMNIHISN